MAEQGCTCKSRVKVVHKVRRETSSIMPCASKLFACSGVQLPTFMILSPSREQNTMVTLGRPASSFAEGDRGAEAAAGASRYPAGSKACLSIVVRTQPGGLQWDNRCTLIILQGNNTKADGMLHQCNAAGPQMCQAMLLHKPAHLETAALQCSAWAACVPSPPGRAPGSGTAAWARAGHGRHACPCP